MWLYYLLAVVYIALLVIGFKVTWHIVTDLVLSGASGILLPILLFIILILVIGPFVGLYNLGKMAVVQLNKKRSDTV